MSVRQFSFFTTIPLKLFKKIVQNCICSENTIFSCVQLMEILISQMSMSVIDNCILSLLRNIICFLAEKAPIYEMKGKFLKIAVIFCIFRPSYQIWETVFVSCWIIMLKYTTWYRSYSSHNVYIYCQCLDWRAWGILSI